MSDLRSASRRLPEGKKQLRLAIEFLEDDELAALDELETAMECIETAQNELDSEKL